jgi:hypothetical protein
MTDSLRERVEQLAAATDGAGLSTSHEGGATTWSIGGRPFAALAGDAVELRLDPAIARAATRTPDTSPSARGPEWVRFNPRELDDHAIDRLDAWFAFARRRAGESAGRT